MTDHETKSVHAQEDVLEAYINWLNLFTEGQPEPYQHTRQDFQWTPDKPYGEFDLCSVTPTVNGQVEVYVAGTGDDGGPATLTAFRDDSGTLDLIIQAFDTGYTVVMAGDACSRFDPIDPTP